MIHLKKLLVEDDTDKRAIPCFIKEGDVLREGFPAERMRAGAPQTCSIRDRCSTWLHLPRAPRSS